MKNIPPIEKDKLNLETAQIGWTELQRFFAQGSVIAVDVSLDLVEVAYTVARDDTDTVRKWMDQQLVGQVSNEQARKWLAEDAQLWSVVVRPLILVQDRN